ncbi:uncharacterized protein FYW61_006645 [Anableps anableps]
MNQSEERKEAFRPLNNGLSCENDTQIGLQRTEQMKLHMEDNKSSDCPLGFKHLWQKTGSSFSPSNGSINSWQSLNYPRNYKRPSLSGSEEKKGSSSTLSVVSLKSENSMGYPANFKGSSSSGMNAAEDPGENSQKLKSETELNKPQDRRERL